MGALQPIKEEFDGGSEDDSHHCAHDDAGKVGVQDADEEQSDGDGEQNKWKRVNLNLVG